MKKLSKLIFCLFAGLMYAGQIESFLKPTRIASLCESCAQEKGWNWLGKVEYFMYTESFNPIIFVRSEFNTITHNHEEYKGYFNVLCLELRLEEKSVLYMKEEMTGDYFIALVEQDLEATQIYKWIGEDYLRWNGSLKSSKLGTFMKLIDDILQGKQIKSGLTENLRILGKYGFKVNAEKIAAKYDCILTKDGALITQKNKEPPEYRYDAKDKKLHIVYSASNKVSAQLKEEDKKVSYEIEAWNPENKKYEKCPQGCFIPIEVSDMLGKNDFYFPGSDITSFALVFDEDAATVICEPIICQTKVFRTIKALTDFYKAYKMPDLIDGEFFIGKSQDNLALTLEIGESRFAILIKDGVMYIGVREKIKIKCAFIYEGEHAGDVFRFASNTNRYVKLPREKVLDNLNFKLSEKGYNLLFVELPSKLKAHLPEIVAQGKARKTEAASSAEASEAQETPAEWLGPDK